MDTKEYYLEKCVGWCNDTYHKYVIEGDLAYLRVMRSFGELITLEHLCNLADMVCSYSEFSKKFCSVKSFLK